MPWNFGYNNPDNPNYFGDPGMGDVDWRMGLDDDGGYGPGDNPTPWTGTTPTNGEPPITYLPGGPDDVPPGFNTPPGTGGFSISDPSTWNLGSIPKEILNMMPGSDGKSIAAGLMVPSWLSAYKQWTDAGKYTDTAKEAAKYGDPFGQANREYYQNQLKNSYEHPEMFLNDPGHQAKLKSGLDQVSRQDAMKGYLGSGNMAADLSAYTANLNNQFLDQERQRLMGLTGAQFNPAAAGEFLMKGNQQAIDSQNAALQALMYPFMMNNAENHITNNNTNPANGGNKTPTLNPDGSPKPVDWSKYGSSPQQIASQIASISQGMGGSAMSIINRLLNDPTFNVDPSTREILQSISEDPNAMGELSPFFPETGNGLGEGAHGLFNPGIGGQQVDYPSPGYNPFGPSDWEGQDFDPSQLMVRDMPTFDFDEPSTFDFTGD